MPKELRKRGKKRKKSQQEEDFPNQGQEHEEPSGGPSWIISARQTENVNPEVPFGYIDPDIKAYFRTVDDQMRAWQDEEHTPDENIDLDPNEAKRLFFVAALNEMSGKERQLATDPECSVVLERVLYSMDDFVRRVFIDSLCGSFEVLIKHRFASHVCQTFFSVAVDTVSRETRGIVAEVPEPGDRGELRTLTQLILDICDEIAPTFPSLIMDPFASHVLRSLLLLLFPIALPGELTPQKFVRSKKSTAWKAKQGTMKSVFSNEKGKGNETPNVSVPNRFRDVAVRFMRDLREQLSANEVRALAANKVASPVLQLLLEIEAEIGEEASPDSLMDRVLVGMITSSKMAADTPPEPSDFLVTLLRDPTSSHLLETLVSRCPDYVFTQLWSAYFQGKLQRLALHPVANFVVSKSIERLDSNQLKDALKELSLSWDKAIQSSRTGVLRSLVDRAKVLGCREKDVCEAVFTGFGLSDLGVRTKLVPCALVLKNLKEYEELPLTEEGLREASDGKKPRRKKDAPNPREPTVQGALLLQSLLKLPEPHCLTVVDSIGSLSVQDLLVLSHNATSSRILDAMLESPTVPFQAKRRLVTSMIGHYHELVDDRIGSRVGDRFWAFADPYLREKIARSIMPQEQSLAASYYGKFFARNLNLYLLKRRPDEWKQLQSKSKATTSGEKAEQTSVSAPTPLQPPSVASLPTADKKAPSPKKSPRKRDPPADEIDVLFDTALGNKIKRAAIGQNSVAQDKKALTDPHMQDVLKAVCAAPSGEDGHPKKRRKR
ncbi:armadillo-type protein [Pisolithus orientalis]|uniref:armadillo-type protein n=1 Tax=Pisolithus orientalis TaxID=936130 RepID=UPI0022255ABE|nr:armadillo-type protein [Pisolithus orientalis]KAI6035570.1 armadillo-type protein [Pisolithus orientalis]